MNPYPTTSRRTTGLQAEAEPRQPRIVFVILVPLLSGALLYSVATTSRNARRGQVLTINRHHGPGHSGARLPVRGPHRPPCWPLRTARTDDREWLPECRDRCPRR